MVVFQHRQIRHQRLACSDCHWLQKVPRMAERRYIPSPFGAAARHFMRFESSDCFVSFQPLAAARAAAAARPLQLQRPPSPSAGRFIAERAANKRSPSAATPPIPIGSSAPSARSRCADRASLRKTIISAKARRTCNGPAKPPVAAVNAGRRREKKKKVRRPRVSPAMPMVASGGLAELLPPLPIAKIHVRGFMYN
ncbi:hypothetical protein TARUN_1493 [Trichoderma arundinaceum]|uniref:Uncharacterized protein n=1 Tax=Trichoderma arundinaceum TaxID=490622 RepID=A0A395NXF4_TRIAR|nr:hypothetical protein TARUN_1493 [Trichoderma arundinaceum]